MALSQAMVREAARLSLVAFASALLGCPAPEREHVERAEDPDPGVRAGAALSLGEVGGPGARETLQQLVGDESPRVRIAAAHGLGQASGDDAAPELERLLSDEVPSVRLAAAEVLSELSPGVAREPLTRALDDRDLTVRQLARQALLGMGMSGTEQVRLRAERRLQGLLRLKATGNRGRRLTVARGLAESGTDEAVAALESLARDEDPAIARVAARGLGRAAATSGASRLAELLETDRPPVLAALLDGLAVAPSMPGSLGPRICALLDGETAWREAAAVVAAHGVECDMRRAIGGLDAEGREDRLHAAEIVALAPGGASQDALEKAGEILWREAPVESLVAAAALKHQPLAVAAERLRGDIAAYLRAAERWVPLPPGEEEGAAEEPPSEPIDSSGGQAALEELLRRYPPRMPRWVELFPNGPDAGGVAAVLTLVAELGIPGSAPEVAALAESAPDELVRAAALSVVGAEPRHLEAESPLIRVAAADWMARRAPELSAREKAALSAALPARVPEVRSAVAEALGKTGDPAAIPPLLAGFERWPEPATAAALGELGSDEAADALADSLRETRAAAHPELAEAILVALGRVGERRHMEAVLAAADHPSASVRAAAVLAARSIGGRRARALVAERRHDFALLVREAAEASSVPPR